MKRLLSISCMVSLLAVSSSAFTNSIEPGFDILKTKKGKLKLDSFPGLQLSSPLKIKLKGNPLNKQKFGNADKIIQRKDVSPKDNAGIPSKIDIKLISLSLKSKAPVRIGGDDFNMKVKLDKNRASKGKLDIKSHDDRQGVGNSLIRDLHVFLDVTFTPVPGSHVGIITGSIDAGTMTSSGGSWSHEADNLYPTIPNFPAGNLYMQPFSLASDVLELSSVVAASLVPLPGSFLLVGGGLLLIGIARKRGVAS